MLLRKDGLCRLQPEQGGSSGRVTVQTEHRRARRTAPILADDFKLSLLCYGHPGPLIRSLRGKFDPTQMDTAIQLGELSCGCWVVLDGNNRIAMILETNPMATVAVLPKNRLLLFKDGEWDRNDLEWCHPNPQTFEFVREHSAEFYKTQRSKRQFKSAARYEAEIVRLRDLLENTQHRCGGILG